LLFAGFGQCASTAGEAILLSPPCDAPDAEPNQTMTKMEMTFDTDMMRSV
jgi:hypothetical protein